MSKYDCRYLPLAVLHQGKILRNHIIETAGDSLSIYPFEREISSTRFISAIVAVIDADKAHILTSRPHRFISRAGSLSDLCDLLSTENLYPTPTDPYRLIAITTTSVTTLR